MTAFAISPTTIDTSTAAQTITVTATITDDVTGNGNSYAMFRSPSGQNVYAWLDPTHRVSGTPQNGTYTATVIVPEASEQGTWTLQSFWLTDRVGNNQNLNTTQIANLGYPTTFGQTGVGDLSAPALTAFAISPTTIDTSTAAQTITVTATITDDVTGNGNSYAMFRSPSGQNVYAWLDPTHRVSGTPQNGTYTATVIVPEASEQGTWTLQELLAHRPSRQQPKPQHHPDRQPRLPHHLYERALAQTRRHEVVARVSISGRVFRRTRHDLTRGGRS